MPAYPWLLERSVDPQDVRASVRALRKVGVPYSDADGANVPQSLALQAAAIVQNLAQGNIAAAAGPRDHRRDRLPAAPGRGRAPGDRGRAQARTEPQ